jgi:hypothetical protein
LVWRESTTHLVFSLAGYLDQGNTKSAQRF